MSTDHIVRTDMLLFLMIPVSLLAFTLAIGPVLVMTLMEHHARKRAAMVPVRVGDDRRGVTDASAHSGYHRPLTTVR
jgi:hypothetical protein